MSGKGSDSPRQMLEGLKDKYKFNTLPLPRKHRNKHRNSGSSEAPTTERVTRKKSFVDMAKRKISRGNKESPPANTETPKKAGVDKDVDKLKGSEKAVLTALKWFLDVVQKETLIMLPGSTTKVLQEIMELNTTLSSCLKQEESSALSSRHNQVYQSLANLIHWADKIVLYGQSAMDKSQGSEVTNAVQNGIRELVKLSIEKLQLQDRNRNELGGGSIGAGGRQSPAPSLDASQKGQGSLSSSSSSPVSPHGSPKALNNCNANRRPSDSSESTISEQRPLSPHEQEVLQKSPITPFSNVDFGQHIADPSSAPPKPPLPPQRTYLTSDLSVPPLPRKEREKPKRSSLYDNASDDGSYPVTIVNNNTHLSRSFSGSSMSVTSGHSDLSNTSSQSRPDSMHSTQLSSATADDWSSTTTGESFDMSRLSIISGISGHSDGVLISPAHHGQRGYSYTATEMIHTYTQETRLVNGSLATRRRASSGSEGTPPPPLPMKQKPRTVRQLSAYENLAPEDADALSRKLQEEVFVSDAPPPDVVACATSKGIAKFTSSGDIDLRQDSDGPPPLPPKTNKHINTYLDLVGGYNTDGMELSFQQSSISTNMLSYAGCTSQQEYLRTREEFFQASYRLEAPCAREPTSPCHACSMAQGYVHQERIEVRPGGVGVGSGGMVGATSHGQAIDKGYETASLGYETMSQGSHDSDELPPAIPPKRKDSAQQSSDVHRSRHYTNPERPLSPMYDLKKKSESMIENSNQERTHNISQLPALARKPSEAESEVEESFSESGILDMLDVTELLSYSTEEEGNPIKGGPVDALLVYAADADRKDLVYYEAFLTTYRMFISSRDLLNKLLYRYKKFRHKTDMKSRRANRNAFFLLLRVAGDLIGQTEDDILKMLMDLVFQLLCDGELMLAKILRDKVLTKIENNKKAQRSNGKLLWDVGISIVRPSINDITSQEIAEQMTIQDSDLFQKIEIPEVLMWAKEQSEELSPNLTIFTEHFNKMSYWVRSLILQEPKAQDREKLLIKFIKVMKHLRKLNNFNSYLAVLSALDSAPVRRLEWQRQTVEGLKEYCTLIDSSSSFRCYRAALAEAEPPCIPYLGLILQDITFVHIGNPEELPDNGGVNFVKCWQYFSILDSMRRFKQHHYDTLKKDERVLAVFNDFSEYLDEEAMWQLSKVIKP
ncbi:rap guanine nucleotide exchange factor 1-like [Diadema antillarum]|uniref:rap guanine nucleotide exchange factor 1-like n=1 Tax=Diadema antillarum TaxID=105358 RepID=UPI003A88BB1E